METVSNAAGRLVRQQLGLFIPRIMKGAANRFNGSAQVSSQHGSVPDANM